jgi:hypothetical protein
MKNQRNTERKSLTRTKIQAGGLLYKSGILDAFQIQAGDDLQDYESLHKAARLLGYLSHCMENFDGSSATLAEYEKTGERLLRYG